MIKNSLQILIVEKFQNKKGVLLIKIWDYDRGTLKRLGGVLFVYIKKALIYVCHGLLVYLFPLIKYSF